MAGDSWPTLESTIYCMPPGSYRPVKQVSRLCDYSWDEGWESGYVTFGSDFGQITPPFKTSVSCSGKWVAARFNAGCTRLPAPELRPVIWGGGRC